MALDDDTEKASLHKEAASTITPGPVPAPDTPENPASSTSSTNPVAANPTNPSYVNLHSVAFPVEESGAELPAPVTKPGPSTEVKEIEWRRLKWWSIGLLGLVSLAILVPLSVRYSRLSHI